MKETDRLIHNLIEGGAHDIEILSVRKNDKGITELKMYLEYPAPSDHHGDICPGLAQAFVSFYFEKNSSIYAHLDGIGIDDPDRDIDLWQDDLDNQLGFSIAHEKIDIDQVEGALDDYMIER